MEAKRLRPVAMTCCDWERVPIAFWGTPMASGVFYYILLLKRPICEEVCTVTFTPLFSLTISSVVTILKV